MSKQALAQIVQRAISDGAFRRELANSPTTALRGFDLTPDEASAIRSGDSGRLSALGVDLRMSKAFTLGIADPSGEAARISSDVQASVNAADATGGSGATASGALVSPGVGDEGAMIDPGFVDAGSGLGGRLGAQIGGEGGTLQAADVDGGGTSGQGADFDPGFVTGQGADIAESGAAAQPSQLDDAIARFEAANTPPDEGLASGGGGVIAH